MFDLGGQADGWVSEFHAFMMRMVGLLQVEGAGASL